MKRIIISAFGLALLLGLCAGIALPAKDAGAHQGQMPMMGQGQMPMMGQGQMPMMGRVGRPRKDGPRHGPTGRTD